MQTAKQEAESMIKRLPENATFEDIQYHLYVLEKINSGIESIQVDGGVPHSKAKERFAKWLTD